MPNMYCFSLNGCISAACGDAPRHVRRSAPDIGQRFVRSSNGTFTKKIKMSQIMPFMYHFVKFKTSQKGTKSGVFYVVKQLPGNFGTLRFPTQHVVLVNTTRCVCHRGTLR